ncbi:DUF2341 domain-containing protein, partial [Candidatus Parcubacteria bacterium]|nr:DUF2341 domain-containing protein [Candidatus Parcubacteria bacterium]
MRKKFKQKLTSCVIAFLIVFQTITGIFLPVDFSLDPPYLESQNAEAASWYGTAGWGYRKKITIDNTKVPNTDQANFPVLVNRLDDDWKDTGSGGNVGQTDGGDFLFTSSDGQTKLSHEIEKYTNTTGELIAWVKIPSLSASADTEIYLYYGNAGCADQWNAAGGTWDSSFEMVQHMNEDPSGGAPQMIDSTGNLNNGTSSGTMLTEDQVAGQVDGSLDFDGTDDYVDVVNITGLDIPTTVTYSSWVKSDKTEIIAGTHIINKFNTNPATVIIYIDITTDKFGWQVRLDGAEGSPIEVLSNSVVDTNWHFVVGTYDADKLKLYIDGILQSDIDDTDGTIDVDNSNIVGIGHRPVSGGLVFEGTLDEVRISNTARTADWIATEYNNQSDPSTFYEIGIQEV